MSAQFNTQEVCEEKSATAMSLLLSIHLPTCSAWYLYHYRYSPSPKTHTHQLCPFPILCREMCRLEEEGQEDKVAWEGLSPNRSICFLVCPPGWLLAPAQLLHSLQPDAKHKHATGLHTSKTTMLTG